MTTVNSTLLKRTEFAGDYKIVALTALLATASDVIAMTAATHGISEIAAIVGLVYNAGAAATFMGGHAQFSGLNVTITSHQEDGTAATSFDAVTLTVLGK